MTHRASRSSRAIADSSALNCKWPGRYREFIRISSCPLSSRPLSTVDVSKIRASFSGYANLWDILFKKHQQRSKLRHGDFHSTTDTFRFGVHSRFAFKCARYNCAASLLMDRWARRKWQWWWNLIRLSARRGYRASPRHPGKLEIDVSNALGERGLLFAFVERSSRVPDDKRPWLCALVQGR